MLNRSKLLAAGLLVGTFITGAAVGGALSAAWGDGDRGTPREPARHHGYAERLQAELALSTEQRDSVAAILTRREEQMHAIWQGVRPRFDSLRTAIRGEIMALLNDEQQGKYQALIERSDSLRALRRNGGRRHGR